jgi:hypothetical protein
MLFVYSGSCSVSVSPGYIADDKKAVEQKITEFHTHLGNREFEAIFSEMHPAFLAAEAKQEHIRRLTEILDRFGKPVKVTDSRIEVIIGAPVQVRAVTNTKFEKRDATEMFNFVKEGSSYKLAAYGISAGTAGIPNKMEGASEQ